MSALTVDARAGFRGASRNALAELRQALTARAESSGSAGADAVALGEELFAVANLLDAQPALRRALTDRSRTPEERSEFVQSLLGGQVSEATAELTGAAVTSTWSRVRDLADALEYAGVLAVVIGAERSSRLDELEDELFRFSRIVEGDSGLLRVLTDHATDPGPRAELAAGLLEGKATDATVRLVRHAVTAPRGRTFDEALAAYISIAAERKNQLVAVVHSAVPLSDQQRSRLVAALTRQYGHEVDLQLIVDPNVVGGLRVQIGDELIDGTLAGRLDDARRRLAG
jgi:F-type H+-transporting ATPase subunit delta